MPIKPRNNKFQADFCHGDRRYRRSFTTYAEAAKWELDSLRSLESGAVLDGEGQVIPGAPRTILDLAKLTNGRYWAQSKSERTSFPNALAVCEIVGNDLPPHRIDEAMIDALVSTLLTRGNGNSTVNRKLAALSKMLTFAFERGWLPRKPKLERLKEGSARVRFLSADEEARVLGYWKSLGKVDYHDLTVFLLDTGYRLSNALELKWQDVDFQAAHLRNWLNKADNPYSVPMTTRGKAMLSARRLRHPGCSVFPNISRFAFEKAWSRMRADIGLAEDAEFVPHACRHTFCSRLAMAGVPLLEIKQLAGHKCIQVTMRYAHLLNANLVSAVRRMEAFSEAPTVSVQVEPLATVGAAG